MARLGINFKNAGNGGFFNDFEVPQMENGWKMGDGKCTSSGHRQVWCSSGILFFVAHTFMSTKIKCPHCELPAVRLRLMDGYKFCCARCGWNHQIVQRELSSARNDVCGNARADIYYDYPPREVVIIKNGPVPLPLPGQLAALLEPARSRLHR